MNRVNHARETLEFYCIAGKIPQDESNIRDLITDLLLLWHHDGGNVEEQLQLALRNFEEEK